MQEIAPSDKPRLLLPSFQGYQRSWLMRDLLAGVTIGAIAIPGQIAVAKVAGMPPTTGLWACVAAGIFAALFVANRVLWIGSDSTTSPLIFAGLSVVAVPGSEQYVRLAVTLAICVGAIFVVVAIAKMQWIADLLSRPVTVGFMAGSRRLSWSASLPGCWEFQPPERPRSRNCGTSSATSTRSTGWQPSSAWCRLWHCRCSRASIANSPVHCW